MTDPRSALGLPPLPLPAKTPGSALTFEQALGSLNGFDEIALAKHFNGVSVYDIERRMGEVMRGVAWVVAKRADAAAQPKDFMALTIDQLAGCFAPSDEDPEGEQGKATGATATSPDGAHIPASDPTSTSG